MCWTSRAAAWALAMGAGVTALVLTSLAIATDASVDRPWVSRLGLSLALGIDGISAPLLMLTAAIGVLVVLLGLALVPLRWLRSSEHLVGATDHAPIPDRTPA